MQVHLTPEQISALAEIRNYEGTITTLSQRYDRPGVKAVVALGNDVISENFIEPDGTTTAVA